MIPSKVIHKEITSDEKSVIFFTLSKIKIDQNNDTLSPSHERMIFRGSIRLCLPYQRDRGDSLHLSFSFINEKVYVLIDVFLQNSFFLVGKIEYSFSFVL